jgi:hypothetical protein
MGYGTEAMRLKALHKTYLSEVAASGVEHHAVVLLPYSGLRSHSDVFSMTLTFQRSQNLESHTACKRLFIFERSPLLLGAMAKKMEQLGELHKNKPLFSHAT